MQQLLHLDRQLLRFINHDLSNPFFNWLMPTMRNSIAWVPLYIFLLVFVLINYKKTGWWWILFGACTVILSNFISSDLIKHNIIRTRPCNKEEFASWLNVLVAYRPQSSSFTSSHAANHFALAMFLYMTMKKSLGKWPLLFFVWAALICFAQVYVGVHYPIDVASGALIGILIGYLSAYLFNRNYGLQ